MKNRKLYDELRLLCDIINSDGKLFYDDLALLSAHHKEIKEWFPNEIKLWEWAGIPEEEWRGR